MEQIVSNANYPRPIIICHLSHSSLSLSLTLSLSLSVSPLYDAADFPLFVARARVCAELVTAIAADVNASAACKDDNDEDAVVLELKRTALGMSHTVALISSWIRFFVVLPCPQSVIQAVFYCLPLFIQHGCAYRFSQTPGLASSSSHVCTRYRRISRASHTRGRLPPPSNSHRCAPMWRRESCTR